MSQNTSHSSSFNRVNRVDVEGRGGYRSPTSHYYPPNQGERGRLFTFSGDTVGVDGRVVYRSHTSHSSPQIVDSRGYISIHRSKTEEINHPSLFNVGESVGGFGKSGLRSRTSPSPSHNSGDHGISSGF